MVCKTVLPNWAAIDPHFLQLWPTQSLNKKELYRQSKSTWDIVRFCVVQLQYSLRAQPPTQMLVRYKPCLHNLQLWLSRKQRVQYEVEIWANRYCVRQHDPTYMRMAQMLWHQRQCLVMLNSTLLLKMPLLVWLLCMVAMSYNH